MRAAPLDTRPQNVFLEGFAAQGELSSPTVRDRGWSPPAGRMATGGEAGVTPLTSPLAVTVDSSLLFLSCRWAGRYASAASPDRARPSREPAGEEGLVRAADPVSSRFRSSALS